MTRPRPQGGGRQTRPGRYRPDEIPQDLFLRGDLSVRTGLEPSKLLALALRRVFKPVAKTTGGIGLYNEDTVEKIKTYLQEQELQRARSNDSFSDKTYKPEDSIVVFAELAKKTPLAKIVVDHKIDPRAVEVIARRYAKMTGGVWLEAQHLERINRAAEKFEIDGCFPVADADTVVEALEDLAKTNAKERVCIRCREAKRSEQCECCVEKQFVKRMKAEMEAEQAAPPPPSSATAATGPDGVEEQARVG